MDPNYHQTGATVGIASTSKSYATPANSTETLIDRFGYEINAIFEMIGQVGRAADRIYGPIPPQPTDKVSTLSQVPSSIVDHLNALQRARSQFGEVVSRLNSNL